jgi:CBS-domain-containing membrane protein
MPFSSFTILDPKFKRLFKRYVFQVSLATGALIAVLLAEQRMSGAAAAQAVLVAAIASTAFVLFITPHTASAGLRASLGGHAWALLIASVLALLAGTDVGTEWITDVPSLFAVYTAVGVGLCMLAMAATNTEHPPAAGTALGVVAHGFDWELIIFVGTAVIMLVVLHRVFRSRMTNLY